MPAELRNQIYELVLIRNIRICIHHEYKLPGLLSTCRQTRSEAFKIYHLQNKFFILDCMVFAAFVRKVRKMLSWYEGELDDMMIDVPYRA